MPKSRGSGKNSWKNWNKRKKGSVSSDEEFNNSVLLNKQQRRRGPEEGNGGIDKTLEVSDILNETNSILYEEQPFIESTIDMASSSGATVKQKPKESEAEQSVRQIASPSNADIIKQISLLEKRLEAKIDSRFEEMEVKFKAIDSLVTKVDTFEKELKQIKTQLEAQCTKSAEKVEQAVGRVDNLEFSLGIQEEKIDTLQKEVGKMKENMTYLQSQSMRNNLVFCNIQETPSERIAETEKKVREFMVEKLKIAQHLVDEMKLERVHRMTSQGGDAYRKIVCKFNQFQDRELVRKQSFNLKGTNFYIHEQFPPEIVAKRKRLMPELKKAKQQGKKAWLSYDTLYVEGKAVKIS